MKLSRNDRDALTLAIEQCRAESPGRAWQIDEKLKDESWEDVGLFAAFCCQFNSLKLKPWQIPPCDIHDPDAGRRPDQEGKGSDGRREAASLLKQMLAVGISKFHPNPEAAIEAARGAT